MAKPRIWGYARVSTGEQVLGLDSQEEEIDKHAVRVVASTDGEYVGCEKEKESAAKICWRNREKLKAIIAKMKKGDHLILWKMDRAERNPFELPAFLKHLADQEITLHVINGLGGLPLAMDTAMGRAMAALLGIASDMFIENLRENTRRALAWRKEHGLPFCRASYAQKIVRHPLKDGEKKHRTSLVWDAKECAQIRELVYRHEQLHESLSEIGTDFYKRELRTAKGRLWVRVYHSKKQGRRLNMRRVCQVYHWYVAKRDAGELPGELQLTGMESDSASASSSAT